MLVVGRRTLLAAGMAVAGLGAGAARAQGRMPVPRPVRIGCLVALSGAQEVIGRPILDGAMIAADQVNENGGVLGRPLEIVPYDSGADPETALRGAKELTGWASTCCAACCPALSAWRWRRPCSRPAPCWLPAPPRPRS